ncbi:hypothetical protein CSUI_005133 [Cystoisospora suis]|uniref:Uncharacterized protein n=1 Tax=Cystoisospora suis TaxID=483139 RepID=A0A2C6KWA6_9APIC|nr:hypothetical protein CSUI_005133 [Cystoisospora suis]
MWLDDQKPSAAVGSEHHGGGTVISRKRQTVPNGRRPAQKARGSKAGALEGK